MLVDLHAHYPMHVSPGRGAARLDRLDAGLIGLAGRLWNYESFASGPSVTIERLRAGGIGVALSVLVTPLLEMGSRLTIRYRRRPPYGAPPVDEYFSALLRQLEMVERRVADRHEGRARVARSPEELEAAIAQRTLVLVHGVEGGFHLGGSAASIDRAVTELARRGVAYITLAHLAWRQVATNAPPAPFWSDSLYDRLFPQPSVGLTELGRAAIRAM